MWGMNLHLSRTQRQQLIDWAAAAHPHECCGLLLEDKAGVQLKLAANVAADPAKHFEIDPATLIAAEKAQREDHARIIGYFHSHPNGLARPSSEDAEMAASDGRIWLIIANGEITAWHKQGELGFVAAKLVIDG